MSLILKCTSLSKRCLCIREVCEIDFFEVGKHPNMVPSGRKPRRTSRKPAAEDWAVRACDLKKEDKKDVGGAEEEGADGTVCLMLGRRRPAGLRV